MQIEMPNYHIPRATFSATWLNYTAGQITPAPPSPRLRLQPASRREWTKLQAVIPLVSLVLIAKLYERANLIFRRAGIVSAFAEQRNLNFFEGKRILLMLINFIQRSNLDFNLDLISNLDFNLDLISNLEINQNWSEGRKIRLNLHERGKYIQKSILNIH